MIVGSRHIWSLYKEHPSEASESEKNADVPSILEMEGTSFYILMVMA
jgi:hypothetical protein